MCVAYVKTLESQLQPWRVRQNTMAPAYAQFGLVSHAGNAILQAISQRDGPTRCTAAFRIRTNRCLESWAVCVCGGIATQFLGVARY